MNGFGWTCCAMLATWCGLLLYRIGCFVHGFATEFRKEFRAAIETSAMPANVVPFRKREEKTR